MKPGYIQLTIYSNAVYDCVSTDGFPSFKRETLLKDVFNQLSNPNFILLNVVYQDIFINNRMTTALVYIWKGTIKEN